MAPLTAAKVSLMPTWRLRRILSSRQVFRQIKNWAYAELLRRRHAHQRRRSQ